MAARLKNFHSDEVRAKIQASQLINRLTDHALGDVDLSQTQIQAIKILLGKSLPDLSSVSIEGPGSNGEHLVKIVREFTTRVSPPHSNG